MSICLLAKVRVATSVALCTMSLFVAESLCAADCGCEIACDGCPIEISGCDGLGAKKKSFCCFSDGFRKFSDSSAGLCKLRGHFKKMCSSLSLGCGGDSLCDDACDAALMDDLMQPVPGVIYYEHVHAKPHSQMHTEVDDAPVEIHFSPESDEVPMPVRVDEAEVDRELFDSLSDPFVDDEAKVTSQSGVQPSSHDEVVLRPIPKRPLSRGYESSRRRSSNLK